jgi:purine-cytosine permease-like protein
MKITTDDHSRLLKLALSCLKYFLIVIFGFAIAYIMSMSFGILHIAAMLLPLVGSWFLRVGILLLCLLAVAVISESVR